jgi:hypothetical protein
MIAMSGLNYSTNESKIILFHKGEENCGRSLGSIIYLIFGINRYSLYIDTFYLSTNQLVDIASSVFDFAS